MERFHIMASDVWLYLTCFSEENIWRDLVTKPACKKCKNRICAQCLATCEGLSKQYVRP